MTGTSLADDQSPQTLVLDSPEDPTVPGSTGNDCQQGMLEAQEPPELLGQAIAAAQSGNPILARLHLEQAIASNPDDPVGWLWLAWVADSPAAAVSALERARLHCPNAALLEHGLAWARGMQGFQLGMSGLETGTEDRVGYVPTEVRPSADPIEEKCAPEEECAPEECAPEECAPEECAPEECAPEECAPEESAPEECAPEECAHVANPRPATQLLGFAEETDSTPDVAVTAECEPQDQGTRAEDAPCHTLPLEQQTTPAEPLDSPTVDSDSGTGSSERNEDSAQDAIASDEAHMPAESLVEDSSKEIAAEGSELAEFISNMNPTTDSGGDASPDVTDPTPSGDEPLILAIDDSPTVRSLVSITLQKCGFNVVTATDGVDALDRLKTCKPAVILMDVNMPRLNGYQLCKLVKKHKEMRDIPVIMLSGKDGVFDKLRGNMCGCDDYITKPFESAELVRKVSSFLTGVGAHA